LAYQEPVFMVRQARFRHNVDKAALSNNDE
jgi:hypothetical protein